MARFTLLPLQTWMVALFMMLATGLAQAADSAHSSNSANSTQATSDKMVNTSSASAQDNAKAKVKSSSIASGKPSGALIENASYEGKNERGARILTIDRTFSTSRITVPKLCENDNYRSICTRLVNYYARRFERDMVSYVNSQYTFGDDLNSIELQNRRNRTKAFQDVSMSIYSKKDDPVLTLFSVFKQKINSNSQNLLVETINFEADTGRVINFAELFNKPELAAMLCARAIEAKYAKYDSLLLPAVISATQLSPVNYIITPKGLRFFFAPGLVKPGSNIADSMLVPLAELKSAGPIDKWWSSKDTEITAQDRQALAKSDLAGVINLDEDNIGVEKTKEEIAKNKSIANANEIKGASNTDANAAKGKSTKVATKE